MGAAISVLISLAVFIIKLHIKVLLFLIKRFDITNSLIVGVMLETLTQNLEINIWIKVVVIALIIAGCIILQHFFKPARIVFGIGSSVFGGMIAYEIAKEFDSTIPFVPMIITIIIVAILNVLSWFGLDNKKEKQVVFEE